MSEFEFVESKEREPTAFENKMDEYITEEGTVILTGELTECVVDRTCKKLVYLGMRRNGPITIILNSVGGEVYLGLLIYNTIKRIRDKGKIS